ncbi:MAG: hypothetical protein RL030_109 [Pseudomonadota bacterium]
MFTGYPDLNYTMALNKPALFKAIMIVGAPRLWAAGRHTATSAARAPVGRSQPLAGILSSSA